MSLSRLTVVCLLSLVALGCATHSESEPTAATRQHDHDHDHDAAEPPESLSVAIDTIAKSGTKILQAFKDRNPDDVHDELHEIGHLIESLPALASGAGVTSEAGSSVANATEKLMDAFGKLDQSLHGGEAPDLEQVEQTIETGFKELRSVLP